MSDDRVVMVSAQGYQQLVQPENGKGLHWSCDVRDELPVKMRQSGPGSEVPYTLTQMYMNAVRSGGDRPSMWVERNEAKLCWTWAQYYMDTMRFAKACHHLGCTDRSAVAIMGFNSPEWAIAFFGGILNNQVNTGIYITNTAEACLYQATHAESEIICVENAEHLKRFTVNLDKYDRVKAFVVWGESALPEGVSGPRFFLWKDFMQLGHQVKDEVIQAKMNQQKPGQCCCLIYTSGTTGNPKGCMLSHDNLTWEAHQMLSHLEREKPEAAGPQNRIVSYLPLSHIAGLAFDLLQHLGNVCELFFARPDALQGTLVTTLQWARPTTFFAVPRVWEKFEERLKEIASTKPGFVQSISGWAKGYGWANTLAQQSHQDPPFMYSVAKFLILDRIKQQLGLDQCLGFFFGAAPLKKASIEYFGSLDMVLFNLYGMSETTGAFTIQTFTKFSFTSAGFGMDGCDLMISNPDENGEGEICMRGRNIMMGYLKNEKATIDTIDSQGYVHSGDRGKIDADGFLKITGRIKELIITAGGENIAPVPVEDNFKLECPACSNIMMIGEQQRFMSALITFKVDIDPKSGVPSRNLTNEAKNAFKQHCGLDLKTTDEAIAEPKVSEYIKKCVEATNKKSVSRASHMRKFKLIPDDFSIPGGELTPTLKLKRKVTEKKFQQFVDEMFAPEPKM